MFVNKLEDAAKLGTIPGLAAMAADFRRVFLGGKHPCTPSLSEFSADMLSSEFVLQAVREIGPAATREEVHQIHTLLRWLDGGLPVFDLTHSLMAALLLTDPGDVDAERVRLPFPTFLVRFPNDFWTMRGATQESHPVAIGTVHSYTGIKSSKNLRWTEAGPDFAALGGSSFPYMSIRLVARNGRTSTWEKRHPIPTEGKIDPWLNEQMSDVVDLTEKVVAQDDHDKHLTLAFRRLLVNLCLYVSECGRGTPIGKRDAKGKLPAKYPWEVPSADIWVLGREVKLDRPIIDAARAWTDAQGEDEGARARWTLKEKIWVRGHWRNQAHGPGRALRTLQWIRPYEKGRGPSIQHAYSVSEGKA